MKQQSLFNSHPAFTLAEVLIALALLGIIAAFAIPKVLQSAGETHKKAIFKETVGEISKLVTEGYLNKSWPKTSAEANLFLQQRLNLMSDIPTNTYTDAGGQPATTYRMKNGASLVYSHNASGLHYFVVDYNGGSPPNTQMKDIMLFWVNIGSTHWCGIAPGGIRTPDPAVCPSFTGALYSNQDHYNFFQRMIVE